MGRPGICFRHPWKRRRGCLYECRGEWKRNLPAARFGRLCDSRRRASLHPQRRTCLRLQVFVLPAKKGAIAGATFCLIPSPEARQKQLSIIDYRKKTQPYDAKSAGCVFRNPSCGHAGALIEQSGLKGHAIGGAEVSTLHANFLINRGTATSADILKLIEFVQQEVEAKKGFHLEHEVRCVPYAPSAQEFEDE